MNIEAGKEYMSDGRKARVVSTDFKDPYFPVIALVELSEGREEIQLFTYSGKRYTKIRSAGDLQPIEVQS